MLDRLTGLCLSLFICAVALYVAVRLIESVAGTLLLIVAAAGAVIALGLVLTAVWRRYRVHRW